jgi:uncharacterized membrane protein YphA (DoxX/SURF4 family)
MNKFNEYINENFDKVSFIGPLFLRVILGVSFFLFGYGKFPLPSEMLVGFGFPEFIAILVPLTEVIGGVGIILAGFIGGLLGQFLTRVFALVLTFFMVFAIVLAHSDWLITADLFKNIQIFLLGVSLYFVFKPKN